MQAHILKCLVSIGNPYYINIIELFKKIISTFDENRSLVESSSKVYSMKSLF